MSEKKEDARSKSEDWLNRKDSKNVFGNIVRGAYIDIKNAKTKAKTPDSNSADMDYDLGKDIGQKMLYAIIMLVGIFLLPAGAGSFPVWLLFSSIIGYFVVVFPVERALEKKSKELQAQENPKRFLRMSKRVWNRIVVISIAVFLIIDQFKEFHMINLGLYPVLLLIAYGLLTKNAAAVSSDTAEERRWKEENGVERVYDIKHNGKAVWRDKNGNYYSQIGGKYTPIPTPVEVIIKDKK